MRKITKNLQSLYNEGGDNNFFGIYKDPFYIQVNAARKGQKLYIDTVSNEHLQESHYLTDDQIKKISLLGFEEDPRSKNFSIELEFSVQKIQDLTNFILKVLDIYGIDPNKAEFEIELG